MKKFTYSDNKEEPEGTGAIQIEWIRNIKTSAYIDPERLTRDIIPLLEHRKQVALRFEHEHDEAKARQLYEMMDYVNDKIREVLAL